MVILLVIWELGTLEVRAPQESWGPVVEWRLQEETTLAEVLVRLPGAVILRTGSRAGVQAFLYRGMRSIHSPLWWQDFPVLTGPSGVLDFGEIPLSRGTRVRVGMEVGEEFAYPSPPGAIVRVDVRPVERDARVGFGSFRYNEARWSAQGGAWWQVGWVREGGAFGFRSDNGTPYNPEDDFWTHRRNNAFRHWWLQGWRKRQAWYVSEVQEGVPGIYTVPRSRARLRRRMARWAAGGKVRWAFQYLEERFVDPDGTIGLVAGESRHQLVRVAASTGGRDWRLLAWADGWRGQDPLADPIRKARWQVHLGRRWQRAAGNRLWSAYLAAEVATEGFLPGAGASGLREVGERVQWWSVRLTGRFPSLYERYGNNGSFRGNPDLLPEWGAQFEWGRAQEGPRRWMLRGYLNVLRNRIVVFQNTQGQLRARNFDRVWAAGLEGLLEVRGSGWRILAQAALREARIRGKGYMRGKRVPLEPVFSGALFLRWEGRPVLELAVAARAGGFYDTGNVRPLGWQDSLDLALRGRFPRGEWVFRVRNLLNRRRWDLWGYPLPGRSVALELSVGNGAAARKEASGRAPVRVR